MSQVRGAARKAGELVGTGVLMIVVLVTMVSATLWYIHDVEAFCLNVLHFFGIARGWVLPDVGPDPWAG